MTSPKSATCAPSGSPLSSTICMGASLGNTAVWTDPSSKRMRRRALPASWGGPGGGGAGETGRGEGARLAGGPCAAISRMSWGHRISNVLHNCRTDLAAHLRVGRPMGCWQVLSLQSQLDEIEPGFDPSTPCRLSTDLLLFTLCSRRPFYRSCSSVQSRIESGTRPGSWLRGGWGEVLYCTRRGAARSSRLLPT
jgi:hypothetical protein